MVPIILAHGIFGFDKLRLGALEWRYFGGIERGIRARGHPVHVTGVHPVASVKHRAEQLAGQIDGFLREIGEPKAVVIAHSMGGLDSRYMISKLGMAEKVAALVTIATPHRGSPQADFYCENPASKYVAFPLLEYIGISTEGGRDLTTASAVKFNETVQDVPGVPYFSVTTACPTPLVPLILQPGYWLIRHKEGPNDSLVSMKSSTWGKHLTTWPVHHMHAINRRFPMDALNPVKSIVPLYLALLDRLAQEGIEGAAAGNGAVRNGAAAPLAGPGVYDALNHE